MLHELINELMRANAGSVQTKISKTEYQRWRQNFVFDALQNHQFGPSFCSYFGIHDNILYYSASINQADQYIKATYIQ